MRISLHVPTSQPPLVSRSRGPRSYSGRSSSSAGRSSPPLMTLPATGKDVSTLLLIKGVCNIVNARTYPRSSGKFTTATLLGKKYAILFGATLWILQSVWAYAHAMAPTSIVLAHFAMGTIFVCDIVAVTFAPSSLMIFANRSRHVLWCDPNQVCIPMRVPVRRVLPDGPSTW